MGQRWSKVKGLGNLFCSPRGQRMSIDWHWMTQTDTAQVLKCHIPGVKIAHGRGTSITFCTRPCSIKPMRILGTRCGHEDQVWSSHRCRCPVPVTKETWKSWNKKKSWGTIQTETWRSQGTTEESEAYTIQSGTRTGMGLCGTQKCRHHKGRTRCNASCNPLGRGSLPLKRNRKKRNPLQQHLLMLNPHQNKQCEKQGQLKWPKLAKVTVSISFHCHQLIN